MKYIEVSGNGLAVRRRDKRVWYVLLGVFVAVFLFSFMVQRFKNDGEATAASLAGFDPGYIISDYQMGNYTSMDEAQIQSFLTNKNSCSNRDYNLYLQLSANKNYTWHWKDGHFVCLSEELFGDGEVIGSGETAAHIIWQAAQDYRINPQVLLVLLQKETSLITDPIPNNGDYRKATGYGCPDTAPCSSQYYGFKNQVRKAAALFSTVLNGGWTNYPLGNNYVQYNPNAGCGGSVVNIRSLATSALYRYTPYQPNAGAIAAGYGTAYCGAYGNRNFYLYFEDWFGGITETKIKYEPMEKPRYMEVKQDTERVTSEGELFDIIEQGMIIKFATKTFLGDGTVCLRTEYATNANVDACLPMDKLKELELIVEPLEKNENKKIIKSGAKKYYIRGGEQYSVFNEPIIRNIVAVVDFNENKYYITEYDYEHSNSEYGFLEEDIDDLMSYSDLDSTKTVKLNKDVQRVEPMTGSYFDSLYSGRMYEFASKINIDNTHYYRTKHNTLNDINLGISEEELEKSIFVDFEVPRDLIIKENVERINPLTGEVFDELKKGSRIRFITKVLINGIWFYRTEHNTKNHLFLVIPADKLTNV
ncbi:MAG: hypothetical protein Q4A70_00310 [Candidatus Saccharibacteria bacterium]|nr:hypothetical protein [Candidatus Saccharibacteria bacterium]